MFGDWIQTILDWLYSLAQWFLDALTQPLVWVVNLFISSGAALCKGLIAALPGGMGLLASYTVPAELSSIAGQICWFIPVTTAVLCLQMFVATLVAIKMVKPVLKFVRLA